MSWCVARIKSLKAKTAEENLVNQGFKVFYPVIEERYPKEIVKIVPMFPGYMFIKINGENDWRKINNTRGVLHTIFSNGKLSVLPKGFVETLQKTGNKIIDFTRFLTFKPGDHLVVKNGPMAGTKGVCKWTNQERVAVLLCLLNRETVVYFNKSTLSRED